jgi:2-polyprenyl-6-methoxyphenol hydroxylase-like FAD-dependent oxidoreductase
MMLGLLLARAGVEVLVAEKHADFLRDFRGDTIHPSTLEVMHELGLLEQLLERPHQKISKLVAQLEDERVLIADFSHLPTRCGFISLMPQWDFLDFLASRARRYPTFQLQMNTEVVGLLVEGGRVVGVNADTPRGPLEIRADLTVGADGRQSVVRDRAGLIVDDLGAPIDVLYMRLSKRADDAVQTFYLRGGRVFVMLDRGDYWQCGVVIPKGGYDDLRRDGLQAFREMIAAVVPFLEDRVGELEAWSDVRMLTVKIDRLREWQRPGLLCIGDAAHAMSPIAGVGINLAIQDAVAAANILAAPLLGGAPTLDNLKAVQRRRLFPTRATQRAQILIQNRVITRTLHGGGAPAALPLMARVLRKLPILSRLPARMVGLGVRPEHVRTRDRFRDAAL